MTTYNFEKEYDLGQVIEKVVPFCKLDIGMEIPPEIYVTGSFNDLVNYPGLVGKKWSRLCGFTFKSKVKDGHLFQFVYVPKFKGTLGRNQSSLSGWYCWDILPDKTRKVITMEYVMNNFQFNISKFVFSDYFEHWTNIFIKNVNYVLEHQLKDMLDSYDRGNAVQQGNDDGSEDMYDDLEFGKDRHWKEFKRYIDAIKSAIGKIFNVQKTIIDQQTGNTHINLAYNAYDNYRLPNLDKERQAQFKNKINKLAKNLKSYRRKDQTK